MYRTVKNLLILVLTAATIFMNSAAVLAAPIETKLTLANTAAENIDTLRQYISAAAQQAGIGLTVDTKDSKLQLRQVTYWDTEEQALTKQHYILRQRLKIKNGTVANQGELMLKYRSIDISSAPAITELLHPAESHAKHARTKFEYDRIAYVDGSKAKYLTVASVSTAIKKVPQIDTWSYGDLYEYFPGLRTLNIPDSAALLPLKSSRTRQQTLARINLSPGLDSKVELNLGYKTADILDNVELSWKHNNEDQLAEANSHQFAAALRQLLGELLIPGVLKSQK